MAEEMKTAAPSLLMMSGGIDSVTLLSFAIESGQKIKEAIFFDYGPEAGARELHCARRACIANDVHITPVNVRGLRDLFFGLLLGEYHPMMAECRCGDPYVAWSIAATYAVLKKVHHLVVGIIDDDIKALPGMKAYVSNFQDSVSHLHGVAFHVHTPLIDKSKSEVLKWGLSKGIPYQETWGCYAGGGAHCGLCGGCKKRLSAFAAIGVTDSATYYSGVGLMGPNAASYGS
jgi:7-cyano-7-deazaguanine synthase